MASRLLPHGRKVIHCIDGETHWCTLCAIVQNIRVSDESLLCITTNETHWQQASDRGCNNTHGYQEVELKSPSPKYSCATTNSYLNIHAIYPIDPASHTG